MVAANFDTVAILDKLFGADTLTIVDRTPRNDGAAERYEQLCLMMDETGRWSIGIHAVFGGEATPIEVYTRRIRVWTLVDAKESAVVIRRDAIADFLTKTQPLAQRVTQGHSIESNGNDMVGHLTEDAERAEAELNALLESVSLVDEEVVVSDAEFEIFGEFDVDERLNSLGVSKNSSPATILDISQKLAAELENQGIFVPSQEVTDALRRAL